MVRLVVLGKSSALRAKYWSALHSGLCALHKYWRASLAVLFFLCYYVRRSSVSVYPPSLNFTFDAKPSGDVRYLRHRCPLGSLVRGSQGPTVNKLTASPRPSGLMASTNALGWTDALRANHWSALRSVLCALRKYWRASLAVLFFLCYYVRRSDVSVYTRSWPYVHFVLMS